MPIGTENGWDRVANFQTLLCGMSCGIVPASSAPKWVRLFKTQFPPESWSVFPLANALMHDRVVSTHHDLWHFVTDDQILSWTLGLGYSLSYSVTYESLNNDLHKEWLLWLAQLQKSVCSRYLCEPMHAFDHKINTVDLSGELGDRKGREDGLILASYGDMEVVCNLDESSKAVDNIVLPGYGFKARSKEVWAGTTEEGVGYIVEVAKQGTNAWFYGEPQAEFKLPLPFREKFVLSFHSGSGVKYESDRGVLSAFLPMRKPDVVERAGLVDGGPAGTTVERVKKEIAVIDLGEGVGLSWSKVLPAEWVRKLERSCLVDQHNLNVRTVGSYSDLQSALTDNDRGCFAIINPYGEVFLTSSKGKWRDTLDAIRSYVNKGGIWVESGGYSFNMAVYKIGNRWERERVGVAGMEYMGMPIKAFDIDQPAESLYVTDQGRYWFNEELIERINSSAERVNRAVESAPNSLPTLLIKGEKYGYVGGYHFDGLGTLWRVGGILPSVELLPDIVSSILIKSNESVDRVKPHSKSRKFYSAFLFPAVPTSVLTTTN